MRFAAVGVEEPEASYQVIARDVLGEACPSKGDLLSSYELALELALTQAPEANALTDVQFQRSEKFGAICVRVTGDAIVQ